MLIPASTETVPNLKVDKTFPADDELDATNPVYGPYTYTFDQVTTKSMKLVVNKKANDNKGITVTEWQVFGASAALPVDPGDPDAFLDVQQVAVRTTPAWTDLEVACRSVGDTSRWSQH